MRREYLAWPRNARGGETCSARVSALEAAGVYGRCGATPGGLIRCARHCFRVICSCNLIWTGNPGSPINSTYGVRRLLAVDARPEILHERFVADLRVLLAGK